MNMLLNKRSQTGVALVVGLLLLIVSSFIALAAFQSGKFQERMASNQYNKAVAFMAAEYGGGLLLEEVANGLDLDDWENSTFADWRPTNDDNTSYFRAADIVRTDPDNLDVDVWDVTIEGVSRRSANDAENLALSAIALRLQRIVPGGGSGAAINLVGPLGTFEVPNSNSLEVRGAENGPAIAVPRQDGLPSEETDRRKIEKGLEEKGRLDNYVGGIGDRIFEQTMFQRTNEQDFVTASYAQDGSTYGGNETTADLEFFVDSVCAAAGPSRCSSTVPEGTVTKGSPHGERDAKLTVVTDDATLNFQGSDKGAGVLVVAGDLVTNGTPSWDGIILVLGGSFNMVGGGTGGVDGTIYVLDVDNTTWQTPVSSDGVSFLSTSPSGNRGSGGGGVKKGGGGGNALFKHNCELVQSSLQMVTDGMGTEEGGWLNPTEQAELLGIWLSEFGCGGITGPGTGPITYRVLRWVETLN